MEIIIALVAIIVIGTIWYTNRGTGADVNNDGKVDLADVKAAVEKTVVAVADVNNDGKVDVADVAVVATKAKAAVKKTTAKAKVAVKKAAPKTASKRGPKPKQV